MLTYPVETDKKFEFRSPLQNPLLSPIGVRVARGEKIPFRDFYARSLSSNDKLLTDFCSELTSTLAEQAEKTADGRYFRFTHRGSNVRRGIWNLVGERNGYPVGVYQSITPWWDNFFASNNKFSSNDTNATAVKNLLTKNPTTEIDLRLEFLLSEDRIDYIKNRRDFANFTIHKIPGMITELIQNFQADLFVRGRYFISGVPPLANIDSGYPTYIGHNFDFYEPESETPILTLDFGTGNAWRDSLYEAHEVGEPYLIANKNGLSLPHNDRDKASCKKRIVNPFGGKYRGDIYTASRGLKGYDILTSGTRQAYIGAFYDPSPIPYIDPVVTEVTKELKYKYKKINKHRRPEITANTITSLMVDPIYTFDSFSSTDYFRQFQALEWLADNLAKQTQLRNSIVNRMTPDNFINGCWNPFLILETLNDIDFRVKSNFPNLIRTLSV